MALSPSFTLFLRVETWLSDLSFYCFFASPVKWTEQLHLASRVIARVKWVAICQVLRAARRKPQMLFVLNKRVQRKDHFGFAGWANTWNDCVYKALGLRRQEPCGSDSLESSQEVILFFSWLPFFCCLLQPSHSSSRDWNGGGLGQRGGGDTAGAPGRAGQVWSLCLVCVWVSGWWAVFSKVTFVQKFEYISIKH